MQTVPPADIKDTKVKVWRVKSSIKLAVMVLSILALSLFFEGWRQVKSNLTLGHFAIMISGTVATIFLLWIQAFWIYVEEKSKGTLKKKIVHFDRLQEYLNDHRGALHAPGKDRRNKEGLVGAPASMRRCPSGDPHD